MPQAESDLPLDAIEAALRKTTEYLATQIAAPGGRPPAWDDAEWCVAKAVVAIQGTAVQLSDVLRWQGPEHWNAFLAEQRRQTGLRHELIARQLARVDARARAAGVPLVPLKGSALCRAGVYGAGERPMGDIDLLVRPIDAPAAMQVLRDCGYVESFRTGRHVSFEPQSPGRETGYGENVGNPLLLELHARIAERLPVAETDVTAALFPAGAQPGLNDYPSPAALMLHLLLHAAGNIRARALRQIQLHDIALLSRRLGGAEWHALLAGATAAHGLWWALPPLELTERYYPGTIPPKVRAAVRNGCPRLLTRATQRHSLVDVSWSQIRIRAFPGIEWARSPAEAARFVLSRVWPRGEALAALRRTAATKTWARQIPWYGQSHLRRIARWVVSRPPRVQTLYAVRSALADR